MATTKFTAPQRGEPSERTTASRRASALCKGCTSELNNVDSARGEAAILLLLQDCGCCLWKTCSGFLQCSLIINTTSTLQRPVVKTNNLCDLRNLTNRKLASVNTRSLGHSAQEQNGKMTGSANDRQLLEQSSIDINIIKCPVVMVPRRMKLVHLASLLPFPLA